MINIHFFEILNFKKRKTIDFFRPLQWSLSRRDVLIFQKSIENKKKTRKNKIYRSVHL